MNFDPSTVQRTVQRTVQLFEETGEVLSIQDHHEKTTKNLSIHEELAIIEVTLENPGAHLHELQQLILRSIGTNVSMSIICRVFKQHGFSRRKLTYRAQQRSEEL